MATPNGCVSEFEELAMELAKKMRHERTRLASAIRSADRDNLATFRLNLHAVLTETQTVLNAIGERIGGYGL